MNVVLSYGLGVDSTAMFLRWLNEPDSRDFELDDLLVVTAMTGNEWPDTASTLADLYTRQLLCGRTHDKALRLAQTITDLRGLDEIGEEQVIQALRLTRAPRG